MRRTRLGSLSLGLLVSLAACEAAPGADADTGAPPAVLPERLRELVPVALFAGGPGEEAPLCSATLVSATAAITVEHCGRAIEGRDDATLRLGPDARTAPPLAWVTGVVSSVGSGTVEGITVLRLRPSEALADAAGRFEGLRIGDATPVAALPGPAEAWAAGYGFGCDQSADPGCCDPRYEVGCDHVPYGRRGHADLVVFASDEGGVWSTPSVGDFLCEGDSGVGMLRDVDDGLELSAVYSGSYLVGTASFAGTRYEGWDRVCIGFAWETDAEGVEAWYASEWVRPCDHEALLRAEVPSITFACGRGAGCLRGEVDAAASAETRARAEAILAWVPRRWACD